MVYFSEREQFLRQSCDRFLGLSSLTPKAVYAAASIKEDKRHLVLGDYLAVISKALELMDSTLYSDLIGGWNEVAELRNRPAHGDDPFSNWQVTLGNMILQFPRLRKLINVVSGKTGRQPKFSY